MSEKWREYKYSEPAIKRMARKVVHRRLAGMGSAHSDTVKDIEQELALVWLNAVEKYNPQGGASFLTYLHNSMIWHVNRYIKNQYERQPTTGYNIISFEAEIGGDGGDNNLTYEEIIADNTPSVAVELEGLSCYNLVMRNLSERAKLFVQILLDQPPELLKSLNALAAKAHYAKSMGYTRPAAKRITAHMVFTVMGASTHERHRIIKEIRGLAQSVNL